MAKAVYVQKGDTLDFTNNTGTDIAYKDVVTIGSRIGVALEPIAVGTTGSVGVSGVYSLPADNTNAFTAGDPLYFAGGKVVKTAGGVSAGWAFGDKATADAVANVKIG